MIWTPQQDGALQAVQRWIRNPDGKQIFRLFGWAGTGKTTLAIEIANMVESVQFAAFTGKAALVMRKKGCKGAGTLHGLIYQLESEKGGQPSFMLDPDSKVKDADLIIVDEVSMVDEVLAKDLMSFGRPILVLGDPEQLPPVTGAGYFTENVTPEIMLTDIRRQAAENPIIAMSIAVREGRGLQYGTYGDSKVIRKAESDRQEILNADQMLVGMNQTRANFNAWIRKQKGLPPEQPVIGDRMICLRNNRKKGLFNGQLWSVVEVMKTPPRSLKMKFHAVPEDAGPRRASTLIDTNRRYFDGTLEQLTHNERRGYDEFDFGYAMTVHKSQGSQWDNVYLYDESYVFRESSSRWLYTGITRAAEQITVVK